MSKAYDRIEWNFLEVVMLRMGFHRRGVDWIMKCISSIAFTLQISGRKVAELKPSRGVRQGDPLSPYLFIIATEVLSLMIQTHMQNGELKGMRLSRGGPMLSHCFFADDALFFIRVEKENCLVMKRILEVYCAASGQEMNLDKSCMFFSVNASDEFKKEMSEILEIKASDNPGRYLGLPVMWGRAKSAALGFVRSKIGMKLQGWKQKLLTFAGKEVLIKAVANSIPVFPMSCFLFPSKTCKEIDALISDFWWGQNEEDGRKIHWKRWECLTRGKTEGGMGFRCFQEFNKALLAKTAWRIISNPDDLWCRILKGLYFPHCDFLEAKKGPRASWCWSSILAGRDMLKEGLYWRIGNGVSVKVWGERWIPGLNKERLESENLSDEEKSMMVERLIVDGKWNLTSIEDRLSEHEKAMIQSIYIPQRSCSDRLIWKFSKDGVYSVKSGYLCAKGMKDEVDLSRASSSYGPSKALWKCLWNLVTPPKVRQFMWRMLNGALATKGALYRRKCAPEGLCPVCLEEVESIEHMLFFCGWARRCWFGCPLGVRVDSSRCSNATRWCEDMLVARDRLDAQGKALLACICWEIWKGRCDWVFNGTVTDANKVIKNACRLVREVWGSGHAEDICGRVRKDAPVHRSMRWQAPVGDMIKINVDGSFSMQKKQAGIGVVCRDSCGSFMGGKSLEVKANSAFMVECLALLEGIRACGAFEGRSIIVEMDCESLYRMVSTGDCSGCEWSCVPILADICSFKESASRWSFSLVARQGNNAADLMAARGAKGLGSCEWLATAPPSLLCVLEADSGNAEVEARVRGNGGCNRTGIG